MVAASRLAVLLGALLLTASVAAGAATTPTVTGVRIGDQGGATRFVLDLTEDVKFSVFALDQPYRLVRGGRRDRAALWSCHAILMRRMRLWRDTIGIICPSLATSSHSPRPMVIASAGSRLWAGQSLGSSIMGSRWK